MSVRNLCQKVIYGFYKKNTFYFSYAGYVSVIIV